MKEKMIPETHRFYFSLINDNTTTKEIVNELQYRVSQNKLMAFIFNMKFSKCPMGIRSISSKRTITTNLKQISYNELNAFESCESL